MFLKNRNIISKIKISKVTDYAALKDVKHQIIFLNFDVICMIVQVDFYVLVNNFSVMLGC